MFEQLENKKPAPVKQASIVPSISAPSQGWKHKIFGAPMSDQTTDKWPEMAKSWAGRQVEFPENAKNVMSVKPMSGLRKMLSNNPYGYTSPLGQISINMDQIRADNQNVDDVMAHEMEHAGQGIPGYLKQLFGSREPENAAINKESLRNVRRGNIYLPSPTTQNKILSSRVK